MRKFRRRRLVKYHDLEQDLLREVCSNCQEKTLNLYRPEPFFDQFALQELNKRQNQLESAHSMLLRHHEMTQELETKQQRSVHGIREGQLTTQHRTELGNQVSCDLSFRVFYNLFKSMMAQKKTTDFHTNGLNDWAISAKLSNRPDQVRAQTQSLCVVTIFYWIANCALA